jgi:hypothetical protein
MKRNTNKGRQGEVTSFRKRKEQSEGKKEVRKDDLRARRLKYSSHSSISNICPTVSAISYRVSPCADCNTSRVS